MPPTKFSWRCFYWLVLIISSPSVICPLFCLSEPFYHVVSHGVWKWCNCSFRISLLRHILLLMMMSFAIYAYTLVSALQSGKSMTYTIVRESKVNGPYYSNIAGPTSEYCFIIKSSKGSYWVFHFWNNIGKYDVSSSEDQYFTIPNLIKWHDKTEYVSQGLKHSLRGIRLLEIWI